MSLHQALDLIFELDETTVGCTRDILRQRDCLDQLSEVPLVVPTFVVIKGEEIWLRVHRMMKGSDIEIQEKKAKLFNEWERFTSTDGESIESYYHRFLKLMNDLKRNKHFPEKIASNLKFLNNLQPEWRRHVTIVHQIKDLHTADYTQLYDFLKYNKKENVRNQVAQNAIQNLRIQNVGNQNGQIDVPGTNQNLNGNGNLVAAHAEGNATSMEQSGEIVEQHPANIEETRVLYDSLYNNLAIEVEKVNTVNPSLQHILELVSGKFLDTIIYHVWQQIFHDLLPNGKLIYNSIINGPYVRRMIHEPVDQNHEVEADDQAIQTILLSLPEDIYAVVDSYETAQKIWLRVQQMMKCSDIGI
nr:Gag-Pol polyprotein [Tanacetum cinerariifolium]